MYSTRLWLPGSYVANLSEQDPVHTTLSTWFTFRGRYNGIALYGLSQDPEISVIHKNCLNRLATAFGTPAKLKPTFTIVSAGCNGM
ncbi:hypothetical protein GJ744_009348 [Endocarpon pusillum]|uniref:Uncharacterized protein n=1 Tax=Endocarpon pusillum TaxID=364733 RepID=A0A8H7AJZ7_9EURO|nr:hypothetical protein GJ744_009348 [Endocarpon pusillum]